MAAFVAMAMTFVAIAPALADAPAAPAGAAGATAPAAGSPAAPGAFERLDLPAALIMDAAAPKTLPWILVVDDPQCPYCMQLHLAIERVREQGDAEVRNSVVVTIPFPLAFHDQAAHTVMDALCLEASGKTQGWSAVSYLDWLLVAPWRAEPGWSTLTVQELGKDNGFFDSHYDAHKLLSSRRRDFQTERARAQASCEPGQCRNDADCDKLCADAKKCREACEASGTSAGKTQGSGADAGSEPAPDPAKCRKGCEDKFTSARYRQLSKAHSACLLEEGPESAHGRTAAAYAWAIEHKVPGTPTVYVGHPSIGFRILGDSDDLSGFFVLLRKGLADARALMTARKN